MRYDLSAVEILKVFGIYAGGIAEFAVRVQDLAQVDPPVYWHRAGCDFAN